MIQTVAPSIENAIGLLLGVCDGAHSQDGTGFNGYDSPFVNDLWSKKPWSPRQTFALWRLLQKYKKQLAGMGFDLSTVTPPADPNTPLQVAGSVAPTPPQGTTITLLPDNVIEVRFPYRADLVEAMRQVPNRTWDANNKRWLLAGNDPLTLDALAGFCTKAGATMPDSLADQIIASKVARAEADALAMVAMADSMATDAEFNVEGLGGVLMPFQRAGAKYMTEKKRALCADEMGLGKTVQALATVWHLKALPVLILCPASLKMNWIREARKWLPGTFPAPYEMNAYGDVCVMTYDTAPKHMERVIEKMRFKAIVFDEAHYLKNHKAKRSEACLAMAKALIKHHKEEAVVLTLTGTPILNRPIEMLQLLQILGRLDDVGGWKKFQSRYKNGAHLEELQQISRSTFLIRREKLQVLKDLPAKVRTYVDIELADLKAYKAIEDAPLEDSEAAALVRIGELRREAARQKLPGVIAWVKEFLDTEKKLVLFATHKDIQAALLKEFPGAAHVLGDDIPTDRQKAVDRFQEDPSCRLIICSLKAAGVGLTLTAASDVAFVEFGWTPGDMDQAEDRTHRIGQKDSVTAWYLRGEEAGIDSTMLELIASKREVGERVLNADRASTVDPSVAKGQVIKTILAQAAKAGRLTPKQ